MDWVGRTDLYNRKMGMHVFQLNLKILVRRWRLRSQPMHQLHKKAAVGSSWTVWEAEGSNSFFYLYTGENYSVDISEGWYILNIPVMQRFGSLIAPRLYVNYGTGFSKLHSFDLRHLCVPLGIKGAVRFGHRVFKLRFDPSVEICEFSLGNISLRRSSKLEAALFMYRSLVRRKWKPAKLARQILNEYRRGGMRKAGDWLYERYMPSAPDLIHLPSQNKCAKRHETLSASDWRAMCAESKSFALQPIISIIMPVYNPPEKLLQRCIQSVQRQAYLYWELCVVDNGAMTEHVRRVLTQYQFRDPRIRVVRSDPCANMTEASNLGLAIASGKWVALLGHTDELSPSALFLVAKKINQCPDVELLYSDQDDIDAEEKNLRPRFDPNRSTGLQWNMIFRLGVYQTLRVRELGGFGAISARSRNSDLVLRCIEGLRSRRTAYVPSVLYYRQVVAGSTTLGK